MTTTKNLLRRWKKPLIVATSILSILFVIGSVGYSRTDLPQAASQSEANRKAALDQGMLMSLKEIAQRSDIPASQNAAVELSKLSLPSGPPNDPSYATYIDQVDAISRLPHFRISHSLVYDSNENINSFARIKEVIRPLDLLCERSVSENKPDQAQRLLDIFARLAILTGDEGSLYSNLIRLGFEQQIQMTLRTILEEHGNNLSWQLVVQQTLKNLDKPIDVRTMLQVEHGWNVFFVGWYFDHPKELEAHKAQFGASSMTVGFSPLPREIQFGKFIPNMKLANIARIDGVFVDVAKNLPAKIDHVDALKSAFAPFDTVAAKQGLSYTLVYTSAMSTLPEMLNWSICRRNALAQGLAILSERRDPMRGLPLDGPYVSDLDGKPIRLKKKGDHWLVYSVNHEKVDNGGDPSKGDFVIKLPK